MTQSPMEQAYLDRIFRSADMAMSAMKLDDTPKNRRTALLGVRKSVETDFHNGIERDTYLRLIDEAIGKLGLQIVADPHYKLEGKLTYDKVKGEVVETDGLVRHVYEIRKQLLDDIIRQVVIVELEKQGYTIISPE